MNRSFVLPLSALAFGTAACDGGAGIDDDVDTDTDSVGDVDSDIDTDADSEISDEQALLGVWDGTRVQFDEYDFALPIEYTYGEGADTTTSVQSIHLEVTPQMASVVQTQVYMDADGEILEDQSTSYSYSGSWSVTGTRSYLLMIMAGEDQFNLACTEDPQDQLVCTTEVEGSVATYTFERSVE